MAETFTGVGIKRFTLSATPDEATEVVFPAQPDNRRVWVRLPWYEGKVAMTGTDASAINADYAEVDPGCWVAFRPSGRSMFIASETPSAAVAVRLESGEV